MRRVALAAVCMLLLASCERARQRTEPRATPTTTGPTISLTADASIVRGNVVTLRATVTGVTLGSPATPTPNPTTVVTGTETAVPSPTAGPAPGAHIEVLVDQEPPVPGALVAQSPGIIHTGDTTIQVPGLTVGAHRFIAILADASHTRLSDAVAETTVTVQGPSVTAQAVPTALRNQEITITVSVSGAAVVEPDGSSDPTRGHLHVLIDRAPPVRGSTEPLPAGRDDVIHTTSTTITVPPLAPGTHELAIIFTDGRHVPFADPVETRLTITVT